MSRRILGSLPRLVKNVNKNNACFRNGNYVIQRTASRTAMVETNGNKTMHRAITKPTGTHLESGAIKNKPDRVKKSGRFTAVILVCVFAYCGGTLSSLGARLLDEYEIFELPDDED